jgi:hypothetical protein
VNKWQDIFRVGEVSYQLDWGDHPRSGDWAIAYGVYRIDTGELISRRYSRERDAKVGAAHMFRHIQKEIEKTLLG